MCTCSTSTTNNSTCIITIKLYIQFTLIRFYVIKLTPKLDNFYRFNVNRL
jgi:hypothetical protein